MRLREQMQMQTQVLGGDMRRISWLHIDHEREQVMLGMHGAIDQVLWRFARDAIDAMRREISKHLGRGGSAVQP